MRSSAFDEGDFFRAVAASGARALLIGLDDLIATKRFGGRPKGRRGHPLARSLAHAWLDVRGPLTLPTRAEIAELRELAERRLGVRAQPAAGLRALGVDAAESSPSTRRPTRRRWCRTTGAAGAILKLACRYHYLPLPRRAWTLRDVIQRLARMGGYEPRKDQPPGWKVIWRGWRVLNNLWDHVRFFKDYEVATPSRNPRRTGSARAPVR